MLVRRHFGSLAFRKCISECGAASDFIQMLAARNRNSTYEVGVVLHVVRLNIKGATKTAYNLVLL